MTPYSYNEKDILNQSQIDQCHKQIKSAQEYLAQHEQKVYQTKDTVAFYNARLRKHEYATICKRKQQETLEKSATCKQPKTKEQALEELLPSFSKSELETILSDLINKKEA